MGQQVANGLSSREILAGHVPDSDLVSVPRGDHGAAEVPNSSALQDWIVSVGIDDYRVAVPGIPEG